MSDVPPPPGFPPPPANLAPPPGYVAYGGAPTPTARVSRIGGLATAIVVMVAIAMLGGILDAIAQASLRGDADDFLAGSMSEADFDDAVVTTSAMSLVAGIGTLTAAVLVMIWMYRITANLRAFGHNTTWHPLFAVFGWFLPPMVLYVIPFLMLREQWRLSRPPDTASPTVAAGGGRENVALWVWLVCFGVLPLITLGLQVDSIGAGIGDTSAQSIAEDLSDANEALTLLSTVGGAVAAIVWIVFVRQLTARHRAMTGEN